MDSMQSFRKLFEYDHWANQAALASLSSMTGATEKPLKVFAHVLGAHRVWRARFDDPGAPNVQPWPALSPEEARLAIERTTCYLRDIERDYEAFNEERTQFFAEQGLDPLPASTGIQAILCRPELLIEMKRWRSSIPTARKAGVRD